MVNAVVIKEIAQKMAWAYPPISNDEVSTIYYPPLVGLIARSVGWTWRLA